MSDSLSHELALGFIGLLIAMIGYLIKWVIDRDKTDKDKINERIENDRLELKANILTVAATIDGHVKNCNEIPKSLILEKIDNLCNKTDRYQDTNSKVFDNISKNFDKIDTRCGKIEDRMHDLEIKHV